MPIPSNTSFVTMKGSKMVANIVNDGHEVVVYDAKKSIAKSMVGKNIVAVVRITLLLELHLIMTRRK